jgi:hypothetical protein
MSRSEASSAHLVGLSWIIDAGSGNPGDQVSIPPTVSTARIPVSATARAMGSM